MNDLIEQKITQWQADLDRAQVKRGQLADSLAQLDQTIQRLAGAIAGAFEIRNEMTAAGAAKPTDKTDTSADDIGRAREE